MARAIFNGTVIAESDDIVVVEGNPYFPISSLANDVRTDSDHSTVCSWKGTAAYWDITVGDETARNAAWYYPEPKDGASQIIDRVAFYPAVTVEA